MPEILDAAFVKVIKFLFVPGISVEQRNVVVQESN